MGVQPVPASPGRLNLPGSSVEYLPRVHAAIICAHLVVAAQSLSSPMRTLVLTALRA